MNAQPASNLIPVAHALGILSVLAAGPFALADVFPDPIRHTASAEVFHQGSPFGAGITGIDNQTDPALAGDTFAGAGVNAMFASPDAVTPKGSSWSAMARAAVDPVGGGLPPILRTQTTGSVVLDPTEDGPVFSHVAGAISEWFLTVNLAGPGPAVYMVPTFNVSGAVTGTSDAANLGNVALNARVNFATVVNLMSQDIPTDGTLIDVSGLYGGSLMIPTGEDVGLAFTLENSLNLVPGFFGIDPPFLAFGDADLFSSAQLTSVQFFADPELTQDISGQVTVTAGGGHVNLDPLIVPEPATNLVMLLIGGMGLLRRSRAA